MQYRCSFCGKGQDEVARLIAGQGAVYICDECVGLCQEILSDEAGQQPLPAAHCSFCAKSNTEVSCIILGAEGTASTGAANIPNQRRSTYPHQLKWKQFGICSDCIAECEAVIASELKENRGVAPVGKLVVLPDSEFAHNVFVFSYACSFCGAEREETSILLAKFGKGMICSRCVERCEETMSVMLAAKASISASSESTSE